MLIQALCDYYKILQQKGILPPEGYSKVGIHYLVALTEDGKLDQILDCQDPKWILQGKKRREIRIPRTMLFPKRVEASKIEANVLDHRPLYLFGLNLGKDGTLTPYDRTRKAEQSHQAFVKKNLAFLKGISSPVVIAYQNFLTSWDPEKEMGNKHLLGLGKKLGVSSFAFCLSGDPDHLLQDDPKVKERWEEVWIRQNEEQASCQVAQCGVTGKQEPIARIHHKIRGVPGGLATGNVLIGFNNESETSYGNTQSYNSNISESVMEQYTDALNYLLEGDRHKALFDDLTMVFWAKDQDEQYTDLFSALCFGTSGQMDASQIEEMLQSLLADAKTAAISEERLASLKTIRPETDFYLLGLKPNVSRLSVKFFLKRTYGEILQNLAAFQKAMQVADSFQPVPLWMIRQELLSPNETDDHRDPALLSALFTAILSGRNLPKGLLGQVIRRVRIDSGKRKLNRVRAGIIKAYINQNRKEEELKVGLNKENRSQAYLCGRLFAVLEKLQLEASKNALNRTIKDTYFASASVKPALVFPKLIRLSQTHLGKVKCPGVYNQQIREIMDLLNGQFPAVLCLKDQGRFDIGYYQQNAELWKKKEDVKDGTGTQV